AGGASTVQQQGVEMPPTQGEPTIAETMEPVRCRELAIDLSPARTPDEHPGQLRGASRLGRLQCSHVAQDTRGLRTQVLSAHFVPRKPRPVEHEHVDTRAGQRPRGRRSGRPAPDNDYLGVHIPPHILAAAPIAELTAFTPSLVSQRTPPAWAVSAPQLCTNRSVMRLQSGHRRRAWSVAPRTESAVDPTMPPTIAATAACAGHPSAIAAAPTNTAPATAAKVPGTVTPPDIPAVTGRQVIIDRGSALALVPISVAQVSDVDAASAPAPTACQMVVGQSTNAPAATANHPPFASTCMASRSPPFSAMPLASPPRRERSVELRKNAIKRAPQSHPAATDRVPRMIAHMAPSADRDRARRAPMAIASAATRPPAVRTPSALTTQV